MKTYTHKIFPFTRPPELDCIAKVRYKVIVVGAGPVGLTPALDLVRKGIPVVLLDDNNQVSNGSRAICFAKRSLEIFNRLGVADRMMQKGITWNTGRLFYKSDEIYHFNLLNEDGHQFPAFINLQQYYIEQYLLDALMKEPLADVRWLSKVTGLTHLSDGEKLEVETPQGSYEIETDYLLACDGGRSSIRQLMELDHHGFAFEEKFLIADIVVESEQPKERWFWFDPAFSPGQSVLLHQQPDNMLRIDFRLGKDIDIDEVKRPENIIPRIKKMLGDDLAFELEWVSVYTFHSRRMERFVHDRFVFLGDAAHMVSPFGARGANSGIQDADNLAWKLKLVLDGNAPQSLLETYNEERVQAAIEHQNFTGNSTEFIAPSNFAALSYRNAILELARTMPHLRPLINSGRLSSPSIYKESLLSNADVGPFEGSMLPGASCVDAPIISEGNNDWFLNKIGEEFTLLYYPQQSDDTILSALMEMANAPSVIKILLVLDKTNNANNDSLDFIIDEEGYLKKRYDLKPGTCYLIRPDQHIMARWRSFDQQMVYNALNQIKTGIVDEVSRSKKIQPATELSATLNLKDYDDFYRKLSELHTGLNAEESAVLNAKLIFLLANEVGDDGKLQAVLNALGNSKY